MHDISELSLRDQDDLHSGRPYWRLVGPPPVAYPRLEGDLRCEVAVVGGGITGALTALHLIQAGVDTAIFDREGFAEGSTVASTGLVEYGLDWPLVRLIRHFGESPAVRAYQCGVEAIEALAGIVENLPGPCGWRRRPTLQFASRPEHLAALREEAECRSRFGLNAQFLEQFALRDFCGFPAPGALWSTGDAELDPYQFTQGILTKFVAQGGRALAHTEVKSIDEHSDAVVLQTPHGRVAARAAVVATGYAAGAFLKQDVGVLNTTYAVASQPLGVIAHWPDECLIWETDHPYFYARRTQDGSVIIGGEDTSSPGDHENAALLRNKVGCLIARFDQLFGKASFRPATAWAGVFGESRDGLPYIGLPPGSQRVYHALGYGGNGITFGMVAAQILTDLFVGRQNADAFLFRFGR